MAARIEPAQGTSGAEFLDLRQISAADLEGLLAEKFRCGGKSWTGTSASPRSWWNALWTCTPCMVTHCSREAP